MKPLLIIAAIFAIHAPSFAVYDPTAQYTKSEIQGFTVYIHPDIHKHPDEARVAFSEIDTQFKNICKTIPEKPLAKLKEVSLWIEWKSKKIGAAEFHVSHDWLKTNGYNPDKFHSVEINNLRNFTTWSQKTQPWMLFHELAHSYHFRVLGANYEPLRTAYRQAIDRKLYEKVAFVHGGTRKAYAATNAAEYFAELSESYFGKNDFFPYTRVDLMKHDPIGYDMIQTAWGAKPHHK